VGDAMIYMMNRALSHLENQERTDSHVFRFFFSAFNMIQPSLPGEKLLEMHILTTDWTVCTTPMPSTGKVRVVAIRLSDTN